MTDTLIAASLKERALARHQEEVASNAAYAAKQAAQSRARSLDSLAKDLQRHLAITVDADAVTFDDGDPVVTIDDLVFSWRQGRYYEYHGRSLHVSVPCDRGCDKGPVWKEVESLSDLGEILAAEGHCHHFDCLARDDHADESASSFTPSAVEDPARVAIRAIATALQAAGYSIQDLT